MKALLKSWTVRVAALLFLASAALAQDRVPFRQAELDQMLAPVALYPDSLLSQMLMASTYPLEVVQAARWSRANPDLKGQSAVDAVGRMDWDPSVKSLTAFPQILAKMDENLEWTERLGEAFLAQQADVMGTVQELRRRADAAGNLRSGEQMRVVRQDEAIVIEPAAPQVVYVPHYSPVVYGPWWWSAYPPVYWAPPPAYYAVPAYGHGFFWGSGIAISTGFFFGHFDWPHRHVRVAHVHHYHGRPVHGHTHWRHDPTHRRGVPFRNADAHRRYEQSRLAESRRDSDGGERGRTETRADRFHTADARQRNLEERRSTASRNRQSVDHEERRGFPQNRLATEQAGVRADLSANRETSRPAPAAETRTSRPEARGNQPGARDNAVDFGARTVRSAPLSAGERNSPQPQAQHNESRRSATPSPARALGPAVGSTARPAPAARTRPAASPAPQRGMSPQRAAEPSRWANVRNNVNAIRAMPPQRPAPRVAVAPTPQRASAPAPRMSYQPRTDRGARSAGRNNGRRF